MVIMTKDRGRLKAKTIVFLLDHSHDMIIEWESGEFEYMRNAEIEFISSK